MPKQPMRRIFLQNFSIFETCTPLPLQEFSLAREQREEEVEKERLLKERQECRERERRARLEKLAKQQAKRLAKALGGGRGRGGESFNGTGGEREVDAVVVCKNRSLFLRCLGCLLKRCALSLSWRYCVVCWNTCKLCMQSRGQPCVPVRVGGLPCSRS